MAAPAKILLAGNPNCGKTSLFNQLTGARQHVANYPGVTVEKKVGNMKLDGLNIEVVDLPGTYSLTSFSLDEEVARKEIQASKNAVIVNIVDASNLDRQLFLTTQLIELNLPMILVLNMSDVAEEEGLFLHSDRLGAILGIPLVRTIASRGQGIKELLNLISEMSVHTMQCKQNQMINLGAAFGQSTTLLNQAKGLVVSMQHLTGKTVETRYDLIAQIIRLCVDQEKTEGRFGLTDRIDAIALHSFFGSILLLVIMAFIFLLTFKVGGVLQGLLEQGLEWLQGYIGKVWQSQSDLRDLVINGIIGGVGAVLSFLPNILILFTGIAILEDSGYMARIVFLTEKWMRRTGLHGKSIMPLLTGFGCTVPAIMATRTLENKYDRLVTILISPLMSCGARLPIYSLIIPIFFVKTWQQVGMMVLIYSIGILLAFICAFVLRKKVFHAKTSSLIMELPPYHFPSCSGILLHTWEKAIEYIKKAGTLLFVVSIVLWAIQTYPKKKNYDKPYAQEIQQVTQQLAITPPDTEQYQLLEKNLQQIHLEQANERNHYTISGRIGKAMKPLLAPLGFDERISTALIGAFAAKEVLVTQMAISFRVDANDEKGWIKNLRSSYSPLQAFCLMLFCLISMPCVSTFIISAKELHSWKWAVGQIVGLTLLAWVITFCVYQVGQNLF